MTFPRKLVKDNEIFVLWVLFLILFPYLILRSIYTPILHDEIATFYYYIQTGIYFPPEAHWDANNHILNSMLSNWSFQIFGSEPWALRLPNVLSYPFFYWFSWKLVNSIKHQGIKWTSFLALVMCHYMFEYFGETRGYGISMAFIIMGYYFAQCYFKSSKFGWSLVAMLSLFLAFAANLTIIYNYLMVLTLLCAAILIQAKNMKTRILEVSLLFLFSGIIAVPLVQFSFDLKERGALYYGGKSSFIEYTLSTLSDLILGSKHPLVLGLIIFLSVLIFILTLKNLYENRTRLLRVLLEEKLFYALLLFGSLAAIFATRYLLDVNFPEDRTALYLYPLMILSLAWTLDKSNWKPNLTQPVLSVLMAYIPIYFLVKIDIHEASFAMDERAPQEFFNYVKETSRGDLFKPSVGGYHTQNLCWYYMNYQAGGEQNAMVYNSFPDTVCDFQIVNMRVNLPNGYLNLYQKINEEPINELNLYRRKTPFKRVLIEEKKSVTNWSHRRDEYFNLLEYEVQRLDKNHPLLLEVSGILHAPHSPFYGKLIISQKDKNWVEISQEGLVFNWLRYYWNDDTKRFHQVLVLPNLNESAHYVQVYVWNIHAKPFLVKDTDLRLFRLE
jgi:hypothetical protein